MGSPAVWSESGKLRGCGPLRLARPNFGGTYTTSFQNLHVCAPTAPCTWGPCTCLWSSPCHHAGPPCTPRPVLKTSGQDTLHSMLASPSPGVPTLLRLHHLPSCPWPLSSPVTVPTGPWMSHPSHVLEAVALSPPRHSSHSFPDLPDITNPTSLPSTEAGGQAVPALGLVPRSLLSGPWRLLFRETLQGSRCVIRGQAAVHGTWPCMVTLQVLTNHDGRQHHACGGSLLNAQWVLSTAHCFGLKSTCGSEWRGLF